MAAKRRKTPKRYYSKTKTRPAKKTVLRRTVVVLLLGVTAAVLLAGLFIGLKYAGSLFFSRNSRFELKTINITTDGRLLPAQLQEYAGLQTGTNLFCVDFNQLRTRLEEVPLVESVAISRQLPDTLTINVVERVPRAQIKWNRRALPFLLDRSGVVLPMTQSGASLPLIEGLKLDGIRPGSRIEQSGIRQCLDILTAADQLSLGSQLAFNRFDVRYPDFVTVLVNGETTVRFPQHSAVEKLVRLVSTLQIAKERGERLKTIDLVPDGRNVPTVPYE
ncbi:MAG: FtsQ-type POTRA domain-containing protein [Kiritimatiellales bacterium]|nr:FtsQ-type POTRA domain-containing protein [Kiritimatiellales bacterium]